MAIRYSFNRRLTIDFNGGEFWMTTEEPYRDDAGKRQWRTRKVMIFWRRMDGPEG